MYLRGTSRFLPVALLAATTSIMACGDSESGGSGGAGPQEAPAFEGHWTVRADGHELTIVVAGDSAKVATFDRVLGDSLSRQGTGNPEVLDAGSTYLRDITRVGPDRMTASYAEVTWSDEVYPWPLTATYQDVELMYADGKWVAEAESLELTEASAPFDGMFEPAGACEDTFDDLDGEPLYGCVSPEAARGCEPFSGGEAYFWPGTTCERLGYTSDTESEYVTNSWEHPDGPRTPGARGHWGDESGTTPLPTPEPTDEPGGSSSSGGTGEVCLVGDWVETIPSGCAPSELLFDSESRGKVTYPECTGQCSSIIFPFDYEVTGDSVTLIYDASPPAVTCNGEPKPLDPPTQNDTFTFECSGSTLTTTTTIGTSTYSRQ